MVVCVCSCTLKLPSLCPQGFPGDFGERGPPGPDGEPVCHTATGTQSHTPKNTCMHTQPHNPPTCTQNLSEVLLLTRTYSPVTFWQCWWVNHLAVQQCAAFCFLFFINYFLWSRQALLLYFISSRPFLSCKSFILALV